MSKATLTIEGFAAKDVEMGDYQGKPVARVTVAHTPRRQNKATGQWEDNGRTLWVRASFWEADAEAVAAAVSKGTLVTITGQPELDLYQKSDGSTDGGITLKFATLGVIPRANSPRSGAEASGQRQGDQWASAPAASPQASAQGFSDDVPF